MSQAAAPLSADETRFIHQAAEYLEKPGFLMRVANLAGRPAELLLAALPNSVHEIIGSATQNSLQRALVWAIRTLPTKTESDFSSSSRSSRFFSQYGHTTAAAATGALGGLFGLAGMTVELPITTMIMLRSIARIARESGEDLNDPQFRLQCLAVLSLGEPRAAQALNGGKLDSFESAYLSSRLALMMATRDAAAFVAQHSAVEIAQSLTKRSSPALVRLIGAIAGRFELTVTEKAAAQAVPVVGAAMGALVNAAFTDHFNQVARYHFGILKLERLHGHELVQAAYRQACGAK